MMLAELPPMTRPKPKREAEPLPIPEDLEYPPEVDRDGPTTAVKAYKPQRDILAQICSMLDVNQQDALLLFYEPMRVELLRLIAKREAQLRRSGS